MMKNRQTNYYLLKGIDMNQIGFTLEGQQEQEQTTEQQGEVYSLRNQATAVGAWILDEVVGALPRFAMVYGFYACVRDLLTSLF